MARTEYYLPAKSRVVVKQPSSPAKWYETQKEVVLPTDGSIITDQCPITNDVTTKRVIIGTGKAEVRIWYLPRMVRSRIVLAPGDVDESAFNEQYSLFHYDVPKSTGFSPCAELYRVAVRLTESAWIVKTGDVPYDLMGRMQDMGCRVFCDPFDRAATRSLMLQAVDMLQRKMDEATAESQRAYERAALQLANSGDENSDDYEPDEDKAVERFNKRTEAIAKRLEKLAEDIHTGATRFGISAQCYGRDRLHSMRDLTRQNAMSMGQAYHRATQTLAQSNDPTMQALAAGAAQSQVAPMVLADALIDAGHEQQAADLQETFSLGQYADTMDE